MLKCHLMYIHSTYLPKYVEEKKKPWTIAAFASYSLYISVSIYYLKSQLVPTK